MTTYLGFDVLELEPNWGTAGLSDIYLRSAVRLDAGVGKVQVDAQSGGPTVQQAYSWFMQNRTDIGTFKTFLAARAGAAVPFWMPTWKKDLVLASDAGSTDTGIVITYTGFTKYQYPNTARRYIALIATDGSGTKAYMHATSSNDPGTGQETISFSAQLGYAFKAASTMVCFLPLCRLASDIVQTNWHNSTMAEAQLSIIEIPKEVP